MISFLIHTPFNGFEVISADMKYSFNEKKEKTVNFAYKRGNNEVFFDLALKMPNKKSGSVDISLTTPFDIIKELTFKGEWQNKKAQISYIRNGVEYTFTGKADVKLNKSSFDMTFTPPNEQPIKVKFHYDFKDFLSNRLDESKTLAELKLELFGESMGFKAEGMRNKNQMEIDLDIHSSFEKFKHFEIELERKREDDKYEIELKAEMDKFDFKGKYMYETKPKNGFYVKCELETSLTPLPGIVFGFGKEEDETIGTIGLGDDREITISIKGKNGFKDGFSGSFKCPALTTKDFLYDVSYKFR